MFAALTQSRHLCDTSYWQRTKRMRSILKTARVAGSPVKPQSEGCDAFLMNSTQRKVGRRLQRKQRKWMKAFTSEPLGPDRAFRVVPSESGSAVDVPAGFDQMTDLQLLLGQQQQALEQLLQLQDPALQPLQQQLSSLTVQATAAAAATGPGAAAAAADASGGECERSGDAAAAAAVAGQDETSSSDTTDGVVLPAAGFNFNSSSSSSGPDSSSSNGGGGGPDSSSSSSSSSSGPDSSSVDTTDPGWQALLAAQREGVGSAVLQLLGYVLGSWPEVAEELTPSSGMREYWLKVLVQLHQSLKDVAGAVEGVLRTDGFDFLVWQTDIKVRVVSITKESKSSLN